MTLLGCLVSMGLGIAVLTPVIQSSAVLVRKQTQLEKAWLVEQDAIRVLELMARAIRMAGYRKIDSLGRVPAKFCAWLKSITSVLNIVLAGTIRICCG
jgi:Tfp pilus assembly protein PilW